MIIIGGNQYGGFVNSGKLELCPFKPWLKFLKEGNNNPTFEYYPSRGNPIMLPILVRTLPANLYPLTWLLPSGKLSLKIHIPDLTVVQGCSLSRLTLEPNFSTWWVDFCHLAIVLMVVTGDQYRVSPGRCPKCSSHIPGFRCLCLASNDTCQQLGKRSNSIVISLRSSQFPSRRQLSSCAEVPICNRISGVRATLLSSKLYLTCH